MPLHLNLACGTELIKRPDWVNLDANPTHPDVVSADIHSLPFEDGSVDTVVASHILEHLEDPVVALKEWHRVLKDGGEAIMAVPNIDHKGAWIGCHLTTWDERGRTELEEHRFDFNQKILREIVAQSGDWEIHDLDPMLAWQLPGKAWWQACVRAVKGGAS